MRERIDIQEAIRLYGIWRCWREVARRLIRQNGMSFNVDAVGRAVRQYDRRQS